MEDWKLRLPAKGPCVKKAFVTSATDAWYQASTWSLCTVQGIPDGCQCSGYHPIVC